MTLQIHAVSEIDPSDLHRLVVDNLGALLGEGAVLIENMPRMDGCCLATSELHDGTVLLSFDAADPQQALLTGLGRMDQLNSETATLFLQDYQPPAALLILAPEAPPGLTLFDKACPISWRHIQVLSVNGEFGMIVNPTVHHTSPVTPIHPEQRPTKIEPAFTPEEEQHFSQL